MNQFQALLRRATQKRSPAAFPEQQAEQQSQSPANEEDGDATQKAASRLALAVAGRKLTKQEKNVAGPIVHYAFGAATGGLYGSAAEFVPTVAAGFGVPFAVGLWLTADEAAVPALGLSQSPLQYPLSSHASALATHMVYGFTTELVRRTLRRAL